MFGRQISRQLVKVRVRIVGVPFDDAVFGPTDQSRFVDTQASRGFHFRQHAALSKSIIARVERVSMGVISNAQRGETSAAATWWAEPPGRSLAG